MRGCFLEGRGMSTSGLDNVWLYGEYRYGGGPWWRLDRAHFAVRGEVLAVLQKKTHVHRLPATCCPVCKRWLERWQPPPHPAFFPPPHDLPDRKRTWQQQPLAG
eukprot:360138-Chlamydomonas_euryale.AAC.1